MKSTLKLRETDPHDPSRLAPDFVPAAWADKVLADIKRDPDSSVHITAAPTVDTTFRPTAAGAIHAPEIPSNDPSFDALSDSDATPPAGSRIKSIATVFLFALVSAMAAAGWQHYGGAATRMISAWTPFTLNSSPPTEQTGLAAQPDAAAIQVSAADQALTPATAQAADDTVPASAESAQLQSMARDLAAMAAQVEQLKAGIAELRANQQAMAKPAELKPAEMKPAEAKESAIKPLTPNPQSRMSMPTTRPAAAAPRRPTQAYYAPAQTTSAPPFPQQFTPPSQPAPPPPSVDTDGEPIVRPPLSVH